MCTSKPKVPKPTPVIERQAYKSAPTRASLSAGDSDTRRRMIAGVATSAQGVLEPASTTKRVRTGGDQQINPSIGSSAPSAPSAPAAGETTIAAQPTTGSSTTTTASSAKKRPTVPFGGVLSLIAASRARAA